jgi:ribonuclease Z
MGQLRRVFKCDELRAVLRDLKFIWISHLHADHHLGTVSVIRAWYEEVWGKECRPPEEDEDPINALQDKRLFVVSDFGMTNWLAEYSTAEDFGYGKVIPLTIGSARIEKDNIVPAETMWNHRPLGFHGNVDV